MPTQQRNSLVAFTLCFVVLLMLLFAPSYFILKTEDKYYNPGTNTIDTHLVYENHLSFSGSLVFFRQQNNHIGTVMGFPLLVSVVVTMISHLGIFSGDTNSSTKKIAAVFASISTSMLLIYAPIGSLALKSSFALSDAEIGWTAFILMCIVNVISFKTRKNKFTPITQINVLEPSNSMQTLSKKFNDPQFPDNEFIDFNCPHCNETVSLTKEYLNLCPTIICPHCGKCIEKN